MTPQEITEFVDRLYATCAADNWQAVETMLTDDFVAHESEALPMAGAYRGKGGLKALYNKVMALADVVGLDRKSMMVGQESAIAVLTMRFADPALPPAELCEMFTFRDGLCCEIKPYYYDPSSFHAAARAKQALA